MTRFISIFLFAILSACAGETDRNDPEPLQCETSSPRCSDSGCSSVQKCNHAPGNELGPSVKCEQIEANTFKCSW